MGHVKSFPNDCDAELRAWVKNTFPTPPPTGVLPGGREVRSDSALAEFLRVGSGERTVTSILPLQAHWPRLVPRVVPQATPSYRPRPAPDVRGPAPCQPLPEVPVERVHGARVLCLGGWLRRGRALRLGT